MYSNFYFGWKEVYYWLKQWPQHQTPDLICIEVLFKKLLKVISLHPEHLASPNLVHTSCKTLGPPGQAEYGLQLAQAIFNSSWANGRVQNPIPVIYRINWSGGPIILATCILCLMYHIWKVGTKPMDSWFWISSFAANILNSVNFIKTFVNGFISWCETLTFLQSITKVLSTV